MHYHAELIMPPTDDVTGAIERYMKQFDENDEDNGKGAFWGWYQIGGRYSGRKVESLFGDEKIAAFYAELKAAKITVSGLTFGKQEISPKEQESTVDAIWIKHFPNSPMKTAPMFKHSGEGCGPMDICKVSEIPKGLQAHTVMICGPDNAETLLHKEIWNGCTWQDTAWEGGVIDALDYHAGKIDRYSDEYKKKMTVCSDWLCVTVDYHS